jgi:hypothetical protein
MRRMARKSCAHRRPHMQKTAAFDCLLVHAGTCRKQRAHLNRAAHRAISDRTQTLPVENALMSTFDDRENAFENKYAHDAEMQFRAEARRNKLLGLWAADLLGKSGDDATDYAKEVVKSDFEEAGHEDVVRKVSGDLGGKASDEEIRAKMAELMIVAKTQIMNEA